ncbi:MAG: hydantoinase/carbamoylase family amidase [Gaiellaceae bacterium]
MTALDPDRTLRELKQLRDLTATEAGAQRVAWTDSWAVARRWFAELVAELPLTFERDEAGNVWTTLHGESPASIVIGGHIDSVPNGGWLDGSLNLLAGLESLRRLSDEGKPPITVRLVDWADEEGARFGRSLLGSSACSGNFEPDELRGITDRDGVRLDDALAAHGVEIDRAPDAHRQLDSALASLELHIEQGPVLERLALPLAAVVGTTGIERHRVRFTGQSAHAGSTPMDDRRDPTAAAARFLLDVREIARQGGGVGTVGSVITEPGIVTAVAGVCTVEIDQRHVDAEVLATMHAAARQSSAQIADQESVECEWEQILRLEPTHFNPELIELCDAAITEVAGASHRMPSGPGHDAIETARAGVPTVMMFVQSLRGLSHAKEEDTLEEHIILSVQALDRLVDKTIAWAMNRQ